MNREILERLYRQYIDDKASDDTLRRLPDNVIKRVMINYEFKTFGQQVDYPVFVEAMMQKYNVKKTFVYQYGKPCEKCV